MNDRYLGKVVSILNSTTVVVNVGADHDIRVGQTFLVVGLGETIIDPETKEVLEQLEIVRGRVEATHVQKKISTLTSIDVQREPDIKEIKRPSTALYNHIWGTTSESVKIGQDRIRPLSTPKVGDYIIED